jgi:hypothetical protein
MVTIEIGAEQKTYRILKVLLIHHCAYFRNALQPLSNGEEQKVTFDNLEPVAFDVFVAWLHTGEIPLIEDEWLSGKPKNNVMAEGVYNRRMNLKRLQTYVVADRLGCQEFLIIINNHYVDNNLSGLPWLAEIVYGFNNIPHDRMILKMLVDAHCANAIYHSETSYDDERELHEQLPQRFLLRVLNRYAELREDAANRCWIDGEESLKPCHYHEHASAEERERCQRDAEEEGRCDYYLDG